MANFLYNQVPHLMFTGVLSDASTLKVMLLGTTHSDRDKNTVDEVSANEIAPAAGYAGGYGGGGRKSLSTLTSVVDDTTDRTRFTGPMEAVWSSAGALITLGTAIASAEIILETGGADSTSYLIAHIDQLGFPYTIDSTTLPFRIIFDPDEIFSYLSSL
jgi:hypothetical protein